MLVTRAVSQVQVEDVMGLKTTKAPRNDWSFFRVSGRGTSELLIWPAVASPLTAATALDDVLLGIDEDANVVWAIEQRVDGVELFEPGEPEPEEPVTPPEGQVVVTGKRSYRYVPATSVSHHWHPYLISDAGNRRRFVQARLADLNERPIAPRPGPESRLLRNAAAGPNDPFHEIAPGSKLSATEANSEQLRSLWRAETRRVRLDRSGWARAVAGSRPVCSTSRTAQGSRA